MNRKQSDLFRDLDLPEEKRAPQEEDTFFWDFGDLGKTNNKETVPADDFALISSSGTNNMSSDSSGKSDNSGPEASAAKIIVSEMVSEKKTPVVEPSADADPAPSSLSEDAIDSFLQAASSETPVSDPVDFLPESQSSAGSEFCPPQPAQKKSLHIPVLKIIGRILAVLLETLLLLVFALYGVMYVLCKGPSPTARNLFVMSVRETSAIGFLAKLYFSDDEIAEIEARSKISNVETDTSLINMNSTPLTEDGADEWGYVDEDGDGIILVPVKGEGYTGYMMIVLDPSRVILGSVPETYGQRGYTVEEMVKLFDGVAGINAGGFEDPNGEGNGSLPNTVVFYKGTAYAGYNGIGNGFVGLDSNNILHVGFNSVEEAAAADIQYGTSFGPVLIINGEGVDPDSLASGVNPRTAIGQRSDGAILMLVIDGRQVISLGATYEDVMNIMLSFGAVNACNLDGGSSSMMWYNDSYVNNCASVIGIRPVPTAFVVLKEGATND